MIGRVLRRPSPALVVAVIALFVALGGTAGAVVSQVVPRARVADNAKKLGGKTLAQVVAQASTRAGSVPGPASTAAGTVSIKTSNTTVAANGQGEFTIACDSGQKVVGGGFASDGSVFNFDSHPANDTTWRFFLANGSETASAQVSLFATCIR